MADARSTTAALRLPPSARTHDHRPRHPPAARGLWYLPQHVAAGGFRLLSAHAEAVTLAVLAAGAVADGVLATVRGTLAAR